MPASRDRAVGRRVASTRRARRMTQADLAREAAVSLSMVRKIEQGTREPGDDVLDALATALAVDPARLLGDSRPDNRVREALPGLSAAVAAYEFPDDGPVRPLPQLRAAVGEAVSWRLSAQYVRLARELPTLLSELARARHLSTGSDRHDAAALLAAAYRAADAVAYKHNALDLSARLIELMRWASAQAEDDVLAAAAAYVRTEVFFAARAHSAGLRALEAAVDTARVDATPRRIAARGALHMRAAVIAGRGGDADAARQHLGAARQLGDRIPEGVYCGTAFGPSSVRIHEISVAVSLGGDHVADALDVARQWAPPKGLPAERRSGFYIELARVQLWAGLRDDAFESLKVARRIAPQHTREHRWVREDTATLRRLTRSSAESLTAFAEWVHAV